MKKSTLILSLFVLLLTFAIKGFSYPYLNLIHGQEGNYWSEARFVDPDGKNITDTNIHSDNFEGLFFENLNSSIIERVGSKYGAILNIALDSYENGGRMYNRWRITMEHR